MKRSRSYYKKFYRLIAVAIAVMTAVLTGSLVLGDSVRGSLVERVSERLGNSETLIQTGTGFLSDSILNNEILSDAKGYLLSEGFISSEGKMIPVMVWGTDNDSLNYDEATLNPQLSTLISNPSSLTSNPIVLHLPSNNLVGSSSLFISQSHATQLRLTVKGIKSAQDGGNILLHNEQVRPLNVFINRQQLAEALGVKGKVNVILSPNNITSDAFHSIWRPHDSGLKHINDSIVGIDRVFLPHSVVETLNPSTRYLAYFVNSLGTIPYSFVTATDRLKGDETILTDYAARRMNAYVGDSVTMEYYVSQGGLKKLLTRSHRFRVSRIVPINVFQKQTDVITADFPGLSGVKRCTDWNSDLPIDMSRITKADEDYWTAYRQTPKALVSLDAVGKDWIGSYGVATKVMGDTARMKQLTPQSFGIAVVHPRVAALDAAQNGTDFGTLFLALGFFIIIAAILLMQNPLSEMYMLRCPEIQLFNALGFSKRQVFRRLFSEAVSVVLVSAPIGVLLGYAYAAVILLLLAGPWSGVVHTDGFALHANIMTVVLSFVLSVILALVVLALTVRGSQMSKGERQKAKAEGQRSKGNLQLSAFSFQRSTFKYYRRQHRLSFITLALGVLTVFAVGVNRPDFSHSSESATGGYQYYGESRIPLQYDLNTTAGRHHLHLDDLPSNLRFLQLPKHTEDEASCMNLNRVATPSVLGMSSEEMQSFGIDISRPSKSPYIGEHPSHSGTPTMQGERGEGLIPIAVDSEALLWSMMKKVGDTLSYHASDGRKVNVVIAAEYPTGIFHGNAIMPIDCFRQLWPDEMGSRVVLVKEEGQMAKGESQKALTSNPSPSNLPLSGGIEGVSQLSTLTTALSDYGFTLIPSVERLLHFFEVTDTYLRIFLSLGVLGLLLGLVSLIIVIRKNLVARSEEIRLYHALGFPTATIVRMFRCEQLIVPLLAILTGAVACLLISVLLPTFSFSLSTFLLWLLPIIVFTCIIIYISITTKTIRQCETC